MHFIWTMQLPLLLPRSIDIIVVVCSRKNQTVFEDSY